MPRIPVNRKHRMSARIGAEQKERLRRAIALERLDLTLFALHHAPAAAEAVTSNADHLKLSGTESLRVLDLIKNPPAPNAKLQAAARALPKRK